MRVLLRTAASHYTRAILVAGVFVFGALLSMSLGMQADKRGAMPGCPFMSGQPSVCSMGALEHMAQWQQSFSAIFSRSDRITFATLFLLTVPLLLAFTRAPHRPFFARALSPPIPKVKLQTKLLHYLVVAFSQGILHPRIYA